MDSKICGLNNIGNTCYMNSALQLIVNCKVLSKFILNSNFKSEKLNIYKSFLQKYMNEESFSPSGVKNLLGERKNIFAGYSQNDSHEFLIFLIDLLNDEFIKEYKNVNKKIFKIEVSKLVKTLFDNQIVSIIYSEESDEKSKNIISENILSIPIYGNKLIDCINKFEEIEILDNDNKWKSKKLNKEVKAYKRLLVKKYAKYLIIHLKRFSYTNFSSKNSKNIKFDELIELNKNKYELRGLIKHMGTTSGGHYISCVKKSKTWYLCNDSSVSKVDINNYLDNCYIYLYSRIK